MELDDNCMGRKENIDYPIDTNIYQHNYHYIHRSLKNKDNIYFIYVHF